jgi:hypothetical protein
VRRLERSSLAVRFPANWADFRDLLRGAILGVIEKDRNRDAVSLDHPCAAAAVGDAFNIGTLRQVDESGAVRLLDVHSRQSMLQSIMRGLGLIVPYGLNGDTNVLWIMLRGVFGAATMI